MIGCGRAQRLRSLPCFCKARVLPQLGKHTGRLRKEPFEDLQPSSSWWVARHTSACVVWLRTGL